MCSISNLKLPSMDRGWSAAAAAAAGPAPAPAPTPSASEARPLLCTRASRIVGLHLITVQPPRIHVRCYSQSQVAAIPPIPRTLIRGVRRLSALALAFSSSSSAAASHPHLDFSEGQPLPPPPPPLYSYKIGMEAAGYEKEVEVAVRVVQMACSLCQKVQESLVRSPPDLITSKDDRSPVTVAGCPSPLPLSIPTFLVSLPSSRFLFLHYPLLFLPDTGVPAVLRATFSI